MDQVTNCNSQSFRLGSNEKLLEDEELICLFCLEWFEKPSFQFGVLNNASQLQLYRRFINFAKAHLKLPEDTLFNLNRVIQANSANKNGSNLKTPLFCVDCQNVIIIICNLYSRVCELKLKLSRNVGELSEILESSRTKNKSTDKLNLLQKQLVLEFEDGVVGIEGVGDIRSWMENKCKLKSQYKVENIIDDEECHEDSKSKDSGGTADKDTTEVRDRPSSTNLGPPTSLLNQNEDDNQRDSHERQASPHVKAEYEDNDECSSPLQNKDFYDDDYDNVTHSGSEDEPESTMKVSVVYSDQEDDDEIVFIKGEGEESSSFVDESCDDPLLDYKEDENFEDDGGNNSNVTSASSSFETNDRDSEDITVHKGDSSPVPGGRKNKKKFVGSCREIADAKSAKNTIRDASEIPTDNAGFAQFVKNRRIQLNLSQFDLTKEIGLLYGHDGEILSQTTMSRFEKNNLTSGNMEKLKPYFRKWLLESFPSTATGIVEVPQMLKKRKQRTQFDANTLNYLNGIFCVVETPTTEQTKQIAEELNVDRESIRVWFANRRQKAKKVRLDSYQSAPSSSLQIPVERSPFDAAELDYMNRVFAQNPTPNPSEVVAIANKLNIAAEGISSWFFKRRQLAKESENPPPQLEPFLESILTTPDHSSKPGTSQPTVQSQTQPTVAETTEVKQEQDEPTVVTFLL